MSSTFSVCYRNYYKANAVLIPKNKLRFWKQNFNSREKALNLNVNKNV